MAQFEELQHLWQHQPELKTAFRRYGRRHDLIYLGKAIVIASQLILLVWLLRHRPLAVFGACLAVFSAAYFLISDWRTQRAIARLNFAEASMPFLRSAIARLEAQRDPFHTREFYIGWGGCWGGLAVLFASTWPLMTRTQALVTLALYIAALFGGYAQAVRVRRRRFEKECRPLIDRLESVLSTMEADRI